MQINRNVGHWVDRVLGCLTYDELSSIAIELLALNRSDRLSIILEILALGEPIHVLYLAPKLPEMVDPTAIPQLRAIRDQMPIRCGIEDYRLALDKAIAKLADMQYS